MLIMDIFGKVLEAFGFPSRFSKYIRIMYNKITVHINIGRESQESLTLRKV